MLTINDIYPTPEVTKEFMHRLLEEDVADSAKRERLWIFNNHIEDMLDQEGYSPKQPFSQMMDILEIESDLSPAKRESLENMFAYRIRGSEGHKEVVCYSTLPYPTVGQDIHVPPQDADRIFFEYARLKDETSLDDFLEARYKRFNNFPGHVGSCVGQALFAVATSTALYYAISSDPVKAMKPLQKAFEDTVYLLLRLLVL